MELKTIDISASGKLIISGEHAVLYGYPCISMCVGKNVDVKISQRIDKKVVIKSKNFGIENFYLTENKKVEKWAETIYFLCKKLLNNGIDISINSKILSGCGSSGAVFSCISCGILLLKNENISKNELLKKTLDLYFEFYKNEEIKPSGIDIITSILGGVVFYDKKKHIIKNIQHDFLKKFNIYSIYLGYKTETKKTIKIANSVKNCDEIYKNIGNITNKILDNIENKKDINEFENLINQNQQMLKKINLLNNDENNILNQCKKQNVVAKISGSGLGDYLIAFEKKEKSKNLIIKNFDKNKIKINKNGVKYKITKSFFAPINIALIKYWGKRDEKINLPITSSISITSTNLGTITKIEKSQENCVVFNGKKIDKNSDFYKKIFHFVNYFIENFVDKNNNSNLKNIKITTKNNIPTASGLASSASGFASLVLALNNFFNLNFTEKKLSQIARIGSGSACRSVYENSNFVKWNKGIKKDGTDCFAEKIELNKNDFKNKLGILVLVLSKKQKKISSREAMKKTVEKSKLYNSWIVQTTKDFNNFNKIDNFKIFGKMIENNSLLMHKCINEIGINYFNNRTLKTIDFIKKIRKQKLEVYFTIDAGANVCLIFDKKNKQKIIQKLIDNKIVKQKEILDF